MSLDLHLYTGSVPYEGEVWSKNITHNLTQMADAAGIYKPMWRPDEVGIDRAIDLIVPLATGLAALAADPERFEALAPYNGWGTRDGLCKFVGSLLGACATWPDAKIHACR